MMPALKGKVLKMPQALAEPSVNKNRKYYEQHLREAKPAVPQSTFMIKYESWCCIGTKRLSRKSGSKYPFCHDEHICGFRQGASLSQQPPSHLQNEDNTSLL